MFMLSKFQWGFVPPPPPPPPTHTHTHTPSCIDSVPPSWNLASVGGDPGLVGVLKVLGKLWGCGPINIQIVK